MNLQARYLEPNREAVLSRDLVELVHAQNAAVEVQTEQPAKLSLRVRVQLLLDVRVVLLEKLHPFEGRSLWKHGSVRITRGKATCSDLRLPELLRFSVGDELEEAVVGRNLLFQLLRRGLNARM